MAALAGHRRAEGTEAAEPAEYSTRLFWPLLAITSIAFAFRLFGLDFESRWNDELFTAHAARQGSLSEVVSMCQADVHPPLYFCLIWLWSQVGGDSEFMLRLPSVVFGTLCVPAVFALGRRCFDARAGMFAAVFTALLYMPWYQSQEARAYALLQLLATGLGFFGIGVYRAVEARQNPRAADLLGFASCALLLAYSHYFGLLLAGLFWTFLLIASMVRGTGVRTLSITGLAMLLAYSPWIPTLLAHSRRTNTWITPPTLGTADEALGVLFNSFSGLQALLLVLALLAFARSRGSKRRTRAPSEALLGAWIVVPFAVAAIKSLVSTPILTAKNMIVAVPAAHVLLGRMCSALSGLPSRQIALAVSLAIASLAADLYFSGQFRAATRGQFREASAFVAQATKGDRIPMLTVAWDYRNFEYYMRRFPDAGPLLQVPESDLGDFSLSSIPGRERIWLLDGDFRIPPSFYQRIETTHRPQRRKEFRNILVTLYEQRNSTLAGLTPESGAEPAGR